MGTPKLNALTEVRIGDAADLLRELPDRSVDLVFTSPPYEDARTYEDGMPGGRKFKLKGQAWVDWLAPILADCCRVSKGLVLVNMSSVVRRFRYTGAVEMLVADLIRLQGVVCGPAPYAWTKNGTPGSGGRHYHRRNWEPVYSFCLPDRLPLAFADPLKYGKAPKYGPGGKFTTRKRSGERVNVSVPKGEIDPRSRVHGKRKPDGNLRYRLYVPPKVANAGNVLSVCVGGGNLGHVLSHGSEAPMPQELAERFIAWYCPPGGLCLDPFAGSGTTLAAAASMGRRGLGFEIRPKAAANAMARLATTTAGMC
ncbi:site-specific DNA-methyltransferase [soil metagenome]